MKSGMTYRYREALLDDVPSLAALPQTGEAGAAGEDRMTRYLKGEHHPHLALPTRVIWLAEAERAPAGYIAGHLTRRFNCGGELQWLYVTTDHRRSGVATVLLKHLANWFTVRGARRICVDVGDESARPFYRRLGAGDLSGPWMVWEDVSKVPLLVLD